MEAEITLSSGAKGRAIMPFGTSDGSGHALERRLGVDGRAAEAAVADINDDIANTICGLDATDQGLIDETLSDLGNAWTRERPGASAIIAISMAIAHASANAAACRSIAILPVISR